MTLDWFIMLQLGILTSLCSASLITSSSKILKDNSMEMKMADISSALKQCRDPVMLDKLVDSLVGRIAAASDATATPTATISSPESSATFRLSCDTGSSMSTNRASWWFEELTALNPDTVERIVRSIVAQKAMSHALISRFLMYYVKNASEKRKAAEAVVDLLCSLDGSSVPCKGLFGVLRISSPLKINECSLIKLERMIGEKLDQATLDNLLVPAPAGESSLYDVNLVLRFLKAFTASAEALESITRLKTAGKLLDSYLAEVAPDPALKSLEFLALITSLPDDARDSHDSIYRAVDMFLAVHVQLSDEEKTKICCALNYEKLSSDSYKHLATNTKFPSRTAIVALISQQRKLRSLLQESNRSCDDEQVVLYAKKLELSIENEKLKTQLQGMQCKLMELERICRRMQRQMSMAMKKTKAKGSRSLPRLCS